MALNEGFGAFIPNITNRITLVMMPWRVSFIVTMSTWQYEKMPLLYNLNAIVKNVTD